MLWHPLYKSSGCLRFSNESPPWVLGAVLSIVLFDTVEPAGQLGTKGTVFLRELGGGGKCEGRAAGSALLGRAVNSFLSRCSTELPLSPC